MVANGVFTQRQKERTLMNIKKSKIYEMIKEELEVILTNDEAHEIFDLDAGALLDAMMKEAIESGPGEYRAVSPREEAAGRLTRRVGTHADDKAATSNVATWAQREKKEILDRLSGIKADGDYTDEEREGLLVAQALEGIVNDALDIVFRDEDSWKKYRAPVLAAAESFRRKLAAMAKDVASQATGPDPRDPHGEKAMARDMVAQGAPTPAVSEGDDKWMQKAFSKNKGGLHRALGVPKGKDISVSKMATGLRAGGKKEKMARAAVNANPDKYSSIKDVGVEKKKKKKKRD